MAKRKRKHDWMSEPLAPPVKPGERKYLAFDRGPPRGKHYDALAALRSMARALARRGRSSAGRFANSSPLR